MKTINDKEARQHLASFMDQVIAEYVPILITRQKGQACVLMSLEEYESLKETAYLLRSPANVRHLMDSIDELTTKMKVVNKPA